MKSLPSNYNAMPRIVVDPLAARMMRHTFAPGDEVSVDTNARPRFAKDKGIYCLYADARQKRAGSMFVFARVAAKRYGLLLSYDNPRFRARFIPRKQVPELRIVGRARMVGRLL